MKIMGLYKHKYNTDVAMCVVKSFYVAQGDYYKIKVRWMNIVNRANIFDMGEVENLKVDRKKMLTEWELIG